MNHKITFLPEQKTALVRTGTTVLAAAARAGIKISQRCDGKAACLTCKIQAEKQSGLSEPNQKEHFKLGTQLDDGVRLACQTIIIGEATVAVPEDPLKAAIRRRLEAKDDDWL
jgi:2Fe-2S ferredoxin